MASKLLIPALALVLLGCSEQQPENVVAPKQILPPKEEKQADQVKSTIAPKETKQATADTKDQKPKELHPDEDPFYSEDFPEIDERLEITLDYHVTNQEGKRFKMSDLFGKPMAVSFVFTNCKNANMCPMVAAKMASLQRKTKQAKIADQVNIILISFDPKRDTPERMKKWASALGLKFDNGMMLQPDIKEMPLVAEMMEMRVTLDNPDDHMLDMMLIDAKGRIVRNFGGSWSNKALLDDFHRLIKEQKQEEQNKKSKQAKPAAKASE